MIWIFILIFIGTFFWLANLHILILSRDWPLILVILGILNISGVLRGKKRVNIIKDLEKEKITVEEAEGKLRKAS